MLNRIVPTSNLLALDEMFLQLLQTGPDDPCIGLVSGHSGYGKSKALAWARERNASVLIRAQRVWRPTALCRAIADALGVDTRGTTAQLIERIVGDLAIERRIVVIDEANYIASSEHMTEMLRDVSDLSGAPLVLSGDQHLRRELASRAQFVNRIAHETTIDPATLEDCRKVANARCEVGVADDLLASLHKTAGGNLRNICVGLGRIEQVARNLGRSDLDLAAWTSQQRDLFTRGGR